MLLYTNGLVEGGETAAGASRLESALVDCATGGDDLAGAVYRTLHGDIAPPDDVPKIAMRLGSWRTSSSL